ncbi:MAG: hypothetical protein ACREF0_10880, partial [Acetobacteraceae bacterium]
MDRDAGARSRRLWRVWTIVHAGPGLGAQPGGPDQLQRVRDLESGIIAGRAFHDGKFKRNGR